MASKLPMLGAVIETASDIHSSPRRIVVLSFPKVRELDIAGVIDVFVTANTFLPPERHYQIETVRSTKDAQFAGMMGMQFVTARHISEVADDFDTLIVPGGADADIAAQDPDLIQWLQRHAETCSRIGSVCTGVFFFAYAGLLNGKRATTHWGYAQTLAKQFPEIHVDPNPIWTRDGNIYSSAGATSGIDLCLALVEQDHGRKVALFVARELVMFLCRPGNQAQFSASLVGQTSESTPLRDLQYWMLDHLKSDLSVPALAARVGMSERNFQRVFTKEVGKSPSHYVEEIRIEAVRRKLERSTQGLEDISTACGFSSADVMIRSFQRQLKTSPSEYRARFRSSGIEPLAVRKRPVKKA